MKYSKLSWAVAAMIGVASFAQNSSAISLAPSTTVLLADEGGAFGLSVDSMSSSFISLDTGFTGTLYTDIYQESLANNPLGGLTFVYRVVNNSTSSHDLNRLTLNQWGSFLADASFDAFGPPAGAHSPHTADRNGAGDVIGFNFVSAFFTANSIKPGSDSTLLILQSDAPTYVPGTASLINGSVAVARTFAPSVPDGGATVLMLGGALGLLGLARRKFAK